MTCHLIDRLKKLLKNMFKEFTFYLDYLSVMCDIIFSSLVECLLCYASEPYSQGTVELMKDVWICEEYHFFRKIPFLKHMADEMMLSAGCPPSHASHLSYVFFSNS